MTMTAGQAYAQRFIYVTGHIYNKVNHEPFSVEMYRPTVVYFDDAMEAQVFYNRLKADPMSLNNSTVRYTEAGDDGYYEIEDGVLENGVLIFRIDGTDPVMVNVDGQKKIDIELTEGKTLAEVDVTKVIPGRVVPIVPVVVDKWIRIKHEVPVPESMDRGDNRMIFQSYLADYYTSEKYDTLEWGRPIVADGGEYHATQRRRMGFNLRRDSLYEYFYPGDLTKTKVLQWEDSLEMPDPDNGRYRIFGITNIENYGGTIYNDHYIIARGIRRPLKYLEYGSAAVNIDKCDPLKARIIARNPHREQHSWNEELNLTFMYASAELDPANPQNDVELNTLLRSLENVMSTSGSTIRNVNFIGVSSPDGSYNGNLSLSKQRISTVRNMILDKSTRKFLATEVATVAPWDSVVPLLRHGGYTDVAEAVQQICHKVQDPDARYQQISRLPEYEGIIKSVLPKLRRVTCQCNFEVFRKPTDEEILHNYRTNPAYRNGTEEVPLYEYGRLFELLNGKVDYREMEGLYKRALESSIRQKKPWHLAANLLAVSYIKRDTVDLNVLRRFINFNGKLNQQGGIYANVDEMWVNQMVMYLKAYENDTARAMANTMREQLGKDAYPLQWALAHKVDFQSNREIFSAIAGSSARNYVVMNLAMKDSSADLKAKARLGELDKNDAISWYLKAVVEGRLDPHSDNDDGAEALLHAWKLDESLYDSAEFDADINAETISYAKGPWLSMKKKIK